MNDIILSSLLNLLALFSSTDVTSLHVQGVAEKRCAEEHECSSDVLPADNRWI